MRLVSIIIILVWDTRDVTIWSLWRSYIFVRGLIKINRFKSIIYAPHSRTPDGIFVEPKRAYSAGKRIERDQARYRGPRQYLNVGEKYFFVTAPLHSL